MRINIHHYLARLDPRTLPDFSQWYQHQNVSVILFSISMVRQFRQFHAIDRIVQLLNNTDERVVGLTIETLGELETIDAADKIVQLADRVWDKEKLSRRLVRCLGKIGDRDLHEATVARFLEHPVYETRFEATLALKRMNTKLYAKMKDDASLHKQNIVRHLEEPLLQ
jgi:HEAT repeat protein